MNWRFDKAASYLEGQPDPVKDLVEELSRLFGDCGCFGGGLGLLVAISVESLLDDLRSEHQTIPVSRVSLHPGELLRELFLKEVDLTPAALAAKTGIPPHRVSELCSGRRDVTPEIACLLGKALGTTPEYWMNLQEMYDRTSGDVRAMSLPTDFDEKVLKFLSSRLRPESPYASEPVHFVPVAGTHIREAMVYGILAATLLRRTVVVAFNASDHVCVPDQLGEARKTMGLKYLRERERLQGDIKTLTSKLTELAKEENQLNQLFHLLDLPAQYDLHKEKGKTT